MTVNIESLERDQINIVGKVHNRKYRLRNVSNKKKTIKDTIIIKEIAAHRNSAIT